MNEVSNEEGKTAVSPMSLNYPATSRISLKNALNSDSGVVKQHARETYEEIFNLAIKNGKMTEARKVELLTKIDQVASNDTTAVAGTVSDIKVEKVSESGDINIDIAVHNMMEDENEPDRMNVCYATANSNIQNASNEELVRACEQLQKII